MSSAVISTSAALSRPFLFDDEPEVDSFSTDSRKPAESVIAQVRHSKIKNQHSTIPLVTPASQLAARPTPEMASSGIPELDALTGGLPRGCVTEICGPASSGRTTVLLAALAAATRRGEYCAVIDASDSLDPQSVADAGVDLDRLLWVRCGDEAPKKSQVKRNDQSGCPMSRAPSAREVGKPSQKLFDFNRKSEKETISRQSEHRLEQVLRATDLLLESGGFGLIILDLGDVPPQAARRIPLTTWFRFRRAIEHKPTLLLAIEQRPIAGSCSSLLLQLGVLSTSRENLAHGPEGLSSAHVQLLTGLEINVELIRSRLDRKPSTSVMFETKTAWTG